MVQFELRNLIPQEAYDVAIYLSESLTRNTVTRLDVEHQGGMITGLQTSSPTFSLPGLVNQDYLLFNNLQPLDLGDGSWGFQYTISYDGPTTVPAAGIVSGLQLEGRFLSVGPPGDYNTDGMVDAADYALWRSDPGSFGGAQGYTDLRPNRRQRLLQFQYLGTRAGKLVAADVRCSDKYLKETPHGRLSSINPLTRDVRQ